MPTRAPDTFTDLLLPAMTSLRGLSRSFLRNDADAEDAHASALERAWRFADSFDPEIASAHTWCATIIKHECIRIYNREKRARTGIACPEMLDRVAVRDDVDIEEVLDDKRLSARRHAWIRAQIRELPEQFRAAIEDDLDGLTCPESAQRRGTGVDTIHGRRSRGRIRIRDAAWVAVPNSRQRLIAMATELAA